MSPLGTHLGILAQSAAGGGNLINTNSLQVNGFRFSNDGLNTQSNPATFTVSMWLFIPSGAASFQTFDQDISPSGFIKLTIEGGTFYFSAQTSETSLYRDQVKSSGTDYRDDSWHQVVVAMNGYDDTPETQMKIWVDGVDVSRIHRTEGDGRPTAWSMNSSDTEYGHNTAITNVKMAQLAYFDYYLSGVTLWNGGAVFDLSSLSTAPVEWYQFAQNIDNSGTSGVNGVVVAGTAAYSTDVPPS